MTRYGGILFLALCSGLLHAQASYNYNLVRIWDTTTEFTSRGKVRGAIGHQSQGFPPGVLGGLNKLTRVQFVVQDGNSGTVEPFNFRVSPTAASGGPDYARGKNLNGTPLSIRKGGGAASMLVTLTFPVANGKPIDLAALKDAQNKPLLDPYEVIHFGWQFTKTANWTTDGVSVHMSNGDRQMPGGGQGSLFCWRNNYHREIPRPEKFAAADPTNQIIERLAWSTVSGQSGVDFLDRSWRLDLSFDEPILQGGADNVAYNAWPCQNPNPGYAALDPDFNDKGGASVARYDDYEWRVTSKAHSGGVGVLFLSISTLETPLSLGGIGGKLYLDPTDPLMALGGLVMGTLNSWGGASFKLKLGKGGSTNTLRKVISSLPAVHAQAYLVKLQGGVKLDFSSVWTFRPALGPTGFRRAQALSGTPVKLARKPADRSLYVRNDGLAVLRVQQFIGASTRPVRVSKVPARMGLRVLFFPAATRVEIVTSSTRKHDLAYAFNF